MFNANVGFKGVGINVKAGTGGKESREDRKNTHSTHSIREPHAEVNVGVNVEVDTKKIKQRLIGGLISFLISIAMVITFGVLFSKYLSTRNCDYWGYRTCYESSFRTDYCCNPLVPCPLTSESIHLVCTKLEFARDAGQQNSLIAGFAVAGFFGLFFLLMCCACCCSIRTGVKDYIRLK